MKTIGKIATAILIVAVIGVLGWLIGAGLKGETLKDSLPEQNQEQTNQDQENTENGEEVDSGVETQVETTAKIRYNAETNTIFCL